MAERPPQIPPADEPEGDEKFRPEDFGFENDDSQTQKIRQNGKNSKKREKTDKPKRGGKREVEINQSQESKKARKENLKPPKTSPKNTISSPLKSLEVGVSKKNEPALSSAPETPPTTTENPAGVYAPLLRNRLQSVEIKTGEKIPDLPDPEIPPPTQTQVSSEKNLSNSAAEKPSNIDKLRVTSGALAFLNREKTETNNKLNDLLAKGKIDAGQFKTEIDRWKDSTKDLSELNTLFLQDKINRNEYETQARNYVLKRALPPEWFKKPPEVKDDQTKTPPLEAQPEAISKKPSITVEKETTPSNQTEILERFSSLVKKFTHDIESQVETLKDGENKLREEVKKLDPVKDIETIQKIGQIFDALHQTFIACNRARDEIAFLNQDAKNHPEKLAESLQKTQDLISETEKKINETNLAFKDGFESLTRKPIPIIEAEAADTATVRKIQEKNKNPFKNAEDAEFEPVLNKKPPILENPPTPEEKNKFDSFIENIQGATQTHLESIEKIISAEEKKPPRGLTLQYLKQARGALKDLWNELIIQIDGSNLYPKDLKNTRQILGNLAATTGAYIESLGKKIASETKAINNAEKIKRFLNQHDEKYKTLSQKTSERLSRWYQIAKPILLRASLLAPLLVSFPTQEVGRENFRGMASKTNSLDSIQKDNQPTLDSLFTASPETPKDDQTPTEKKFGYRSSRLLSPEDRRLRDSLAEEHMADNRFEMLTLNSKITKPEYDRIKNMPFKEFMTKYLDDFFTPDSSLSQDELKHRRSFAKEISYIKNLNLESTQSVEDELISLYYKKTK